LYLGLYSTETAAAQTYDLASLKIRGRNSHTNFPAEQYLDVNGQLPADEHLDGVITELKAEAARQLLTELQDDPMLHVRQPGSNPAETIALIRQRVGLRRMTGLEQDLMEAISAERNGAAENLAAPGLAVPEQDYHTDDDASPAGSLDKTAESLPHVHQHEPLNSDRLGSVIPMSELSIPTMHQLLRMEDQDLAATSPPQAALAAAANQLPRSCSGMLGGQQLLSGTNWLGTTNLQVSGAPVVPCGSGVAPAAPAAMPNESIYRQQDDMQQLQQLQLQSQASLGFVPLMATNGQPAELNVSAAMQPTAQQHPQAASASPATAAVASSANSPHGVSYNCAVAAQVAAGNPFSSDGGISCVSFGWLQNHLPPHCLLQHIMNHASGLCGMLYAQPSTAAPSGVLWGGAVWDGNSFRYSQLYGSAAEAARLCHSVLQLIAGCKQADTDPNMPHQLLAMGD
jgi:hypothetical protein